MLELSDRWNPVLVREIRRTLRSRLFLGTFLLLLLACWLSCVYLIFSRGAWGNSMSEGRDFCRIYFLVLLVPICLVVPVSIFLVSSEERRGMTLESLVLTKLKPSQILNGYLGCGILQAGLYFSALSPYISFGYLLNGVDIIQLLAAFLVVFLFGCASGMWGLLMGTAVRGTALSYGTFFTNSLLGGLISYAVSYKLLTWIFSVSGSIYWIGVFLVGLLCFVGPPTFFFLSMFTGLTSRLIQIRHPMKRPYRVILDEQGKILRFKPDPAGVYEQVPEWDFPVQSDLDGLKERE